MINPQGQNYIGLSEDVSKRLAQHNDGISRWARRSSRPSQWFMAKPRRVRPRRSNCSS
ncbi:MAG: GIY-YIG nuclease family protein [Verrucomicrobia bacterium]|nr:GIY-YIG nuclease family protein [Verrucomicrobiota bacterium]